MLFLSWNPATVNTIKICIKFLRFINFSNFQFRVTKNCRSGLPYFRNPSWDYFKIGLIFLIVIPKYENNYKISWEHDTRTFPLQALCARDRSPAGDTTQLFNNHDYKCCANAVTDGKITLQLPKVIFLQTDTLVVPTVSLSFP